MKRHDPANATRNKVMEKFNVWRNAIAHQDFTSKELDGRTTVTLAMVRKWRGTCEASRWTSIRWSVHGWL